MPGKGRIVTNVVTYDTGPLNLILHNPPLDLNHPPQCLRGCKEKTSVPSLAVSPTPSYNSLVEAARTYLIIGRLRVCCHRRRRYDRHTPYRDSYPGVLLEYRFFLKIAGGKKFKTLMWQFYTTLKMAILYTTFVSKSILQCVETAAREILPRSTIQMKGRSGPAFPKIGEMTVHLPAGRPVVVDRSVVVV